MLQLDVNESSCFMQRYSFKKKQGFIGFITSYWLENSVGNHLLSTEKVEVIEIKPSGSYGLSLVRKVIITSMLIKQLFFRYKHCSSQKVYVQVVIYVFLSIDSC